MEHAERRGRDGTTRWLILAASFVVIIAGIKAAASLLLPFIVALFLAMVSLPLLTWLHARRVPSGLAVLITVTVVAAVVFSLGALIGGSISSFTDAAPRYRLRLEQMLVELLDWLTARGLTIPQDYTREIVRPGAMMDLAATTLRGVASVLSNLLLVFLTVVFIYLEAAGFPAKLQAAFGRAGGVERYERIRREINRYLSFKTLISLVTGVLIGSAMAVIGVDFPVVWGTLAFLLNYIPNLGSIIAAIPPVLLAAVQLGWGEAFAAALVFLVVNLTLGSLIEPYLMGRRLGLSTLVIFVSLVFWGWVWGPVGMLLSVPITMIIKITLENSTDLKWIAVLLDAAPPPEEPIAEEAERT
ncbi:MAG TPA: AI-2E family transporter [Candidatus Polarisedimenticolaceae bacterium]|nr:AI-2E family transporter [Candidatus Polarisedimenticolaceae bacterium]